MVRRGYEERVEFKTDTGFTDAVRNPPPIGLQSDIQIPSLHPVANLGSVRIREAE